MAKYFVGMSGHLKSGATGHYEEFHKGLFDALRSSEIFDEVSYLGSTLSDSAWFEPIVPPSLVSAGSWCDRNFRSNLQVIAEDKSGLVFHIYEGNLFQLFLLSELLRKNENSKAILNLFDSAKLRRVLSSPIKRILFKKFLLIALRNIEDRCVVTADTYRMARQLEDLLNVKIFSYPMYSILSAKEMKVSEKNDYLFMIRGSEAMDNLIASLRGQNVEFLRRITVHGVPTQEQIEFSENVLGISVSKKHLSRQEYIDFFNRFSHIAFLYDPNLFRDQSSGRLCDALVAGAHVLVPKDCALWDSANEFGGFSEFDFHNVADAIDVIQDFSQPQFPRTSRLLPEAECAVTDLVALLDNTKEISKARYSNIVFRSAYFILRKYQYILRFYTAIKIRVERRLPKR